MDLQGLPVVALARAHVAGDVDVGQEMHLDLDLSIAGAGLAPSPLDVEGEAARLVAARPGLGCAGHELPNRVEHVRVRCRVRTRRAADRRLIDVDHLVDLEQAFHPLIGAGLFGGPMESPCPRLVEDVIDERRLSRTGDPGHRGHDPQRKAGINPFQVVLPRAPHDDGLPGSLSALLRGGDLDIAGEVARRQGFGELR